MEIYQGAAEWAERNFGGAKLGDERRVKRVIKIASAMAERPGSSIPELFMNTYDVKATYTFFDKEQANPDNIQRGHREEVKKELAEEGEYLLLEDTTEMIWSHNEKKEGTGPVGNGSETMQGFHLHSVLAVKWQWEQEKKEKRPAVKIVGLADQQYYIRKDKEVDHGSRRRGKKGELETELWERASERIGKGQKAAVWVRVCDRGADIYEFLTGCQDNEHEFLVRAKHDRVLVDDNEKKTGHLFETIRKSRALGEFVLHLPARDKKPARTAHLFVSAEEISLRAPTRVGVPASKNPQIKCTVIRVWEEIESPEQEPIEWILLSSRKVANFDQALKYVLQYSTRWIIEEFHKALKTGLGAERLQLEKAHRLFSAIAIMSIVSLRLINLREQVRLHAVAAAQESGLTKVELEVLSLKLSRPLHTIKDVALAIGRLGGHLNRKSDGMPGWLTLWRGMLKLQFLVEGYLIAHNS